MNSAVLNFFKDFLPNLSIFLPNLDPSTCKLEITSNISSLQPVNEAKYVNNLQYHTVIIHSTLQYYIVIIQSTLHNAIIQSTIQYHTAIIHSTLQCYTVINQSTLHTAIIHQSCSIILSSITQSYSNILSSVSQHYSILQS